MRRHLQVLIVIIALLLPAALYADTGTYKITDYSVNLAPHSDGLVSISYRQTWFVESGSIPWITVGVPNSNFSVESYSGAIASIQNTSQGSWSGVRIDLDKDYQPGEAFTVSFDIKQNKLFYADETNYRLDFTPGWYDRAFIDKLEISVRFFVPLDSVTADPAPTETSGEEMHWRKTELGKGERLSISVSFPKSVLAEAMAEENLQKRVSGNVILAIVLIVLVVIALAFLVFSLLDIGGGSEYSSYGSSGYSSGRRSSYSGGSLYYGSSSRSSGSSRSSSHSSGGGGGFGGRSTSCACACVSCACACACAGGGAAGCSPKTRHSCPACSNGKMK